MRLSPSRLLILLDEILRKVPVVSNLYHRLDRWLPRPAFVRRLRQRPPVFVYQMGKVGSTSIYNSLRKYYPGEVLHAHKFGTASDVGSIHRFYSVVRKEPLPVKIICPIRDPLSHNVSALFQNFRHYTGYRFRDYPGSVDDLLATFLQEGYHVHPLIWLDDNLLANFGIDVYTTPFPASGHCTYRNGQVEALVIRHDVPDAKKTAVISEFVGCANFTLHNANISSHKVYAEMYRSMKKRKLPAPYVEEMLDAKYTRHFYGREISTLRQQWTASPDPAA